MTKTENIIWTAIRGKKLEGIQFYRQKVLGPYIVDFYAPAVNLIIEIDGMHHFKKENAEQDRYRDAYLNALGLNVLRFSNHQVHNAPSKVIAHILSFIQRFKLLKRQDREKPTLKKGVGSANVSEQTGGIS